MRRFHRLILATSIALGALSLSVFTPMGGTAQAEYWEKPGFGYAPPPPVYYVPPGPLFVPPPPVFFAPPPPRFYAPPVYYGPRPYYGRPHHGPHRRW